METISQAASSLNRQLAGLIPSDASLIAPDFLILPILPLELTLRASELAGQYGTNADLLRDLTIQYNNVLMEGAKAISSSLGSGSRGNVFTYDVPSWMHAMKTYPLRYGIGSDLTNPCGLTNCPNPQNYVFW
jgi:phospholipase/lecithinase/hemolysin